MAIQTRNKRKVEFSMASMSDLVFLLLIFFMLTSTLIAPNAIKLLLPSSDSKTMAKPATVTVYIDEQLAYFVDGRPVDELVLGKELAGALQGQKDASVVLRANKNVAVQYVVTVIDAVNSVNRLSNTKHKVILATQPKSTNE
ncbi:MAG: biopolymer transporter ExbD [Bacteroidales bacterium]|nr:biopolymer transporter ExbD [Lentimicrobiaceae bacterium]MDD5695723.1 biopolymer transporter ExbD [Bacteroidales bacterium]